MPNFETFQKRSITVSTEPRVTLQRKGPISLNKAAYQALGEPPAIELLFDREAKIVGLRGASSRKANAYSVRVVGKSTYLVAGSAFTKYYGIRVDESRRFPARMYGDVLGFDLHEGKPVTSNRNGRNGHATRSGAGETQRSPWRSSQAEGVHSQGEARQAVGV
jgi:hypothetical protein